MLTKITATIQTTMCSTQKLQSVVRKTTMHTTLNHKRTTLYYTTQRFFFLTSTVHYVACMLMCVCCVCVHACAHMHPHTCMHMHVYVFVYVHVCARIHKCNKSMNRRAHNRASMYPAICYVALKLTSSIKSKISINPSRDNLYGVISYSILSYTRVASEIIHRNRHDGEL